MPANKRALMCPPDTSRADDRYQARLFSRVWLESKGLVSAIPERLQKQYIVLP